MNQLKRAFQWDLGRQIERPDFLIKWLPRYAEWGYQQLYLYLEDAFDFPSVPGIGRPHAFDAAQMGKLVAEAGRCGIEVIPIVPLLGHAGYLLKADKLRHLSESRDQQGNPLMAGQICPLHSGILPLAKKLIKDVEPYCTAGIFHASLDESFDIGKCPCCRKEVEEIGLAAHFANYVKRLHGVSRGRGLRLGMWADMLYYVPDAIGMLPKDIVAYDWFYYPFKSLPRVELYNFVDVDLTGMLRKAGIDVFGCPNNGPFFSEPMPPFLDRLENIVSWWDYCHRKEAQGMLITSWSPVRSSVELNFLVDAAAASLWLEPRECESRRMLEQGLQRIYGKKSVHFASCIAAAEKYQFSGNYRWQANKTWTSLASLDSVEPWQREEKHFRKLVKQAAEAPVPLRKSLEFRHYIAKRDLFVREASLELVEGRKLARQRRGVRFQQIIKRLQSRTKRFGVSISKAIDATQTLWRRSRFASDANPNEAMLRTELTRIGELQAFFSRALKDSQCILEGCPLLGRWHLLFNARNFAPALQGVAVEREMPDGTWQTVHSLYSLEFTADAGQPSANFVRRHSVALDWDFNDPLHLRLAVRGIGELEIYNVQLTNGITTYAPLKIKRVKGPVRRVKNLLHPAEPGAVMGNPPPSHGFPSIFWGENQSLVELTFDHRV